MDISLYKGEDQLDEIERKRKGEEKKNEKKTGRKEVKQRVEKEVKDEIDFKPEVKKRGGRAKEDVSVEKVKQAEPRKGRRAASNISYDHDSYDFLEEDDDEVMPAPKKRKSQDSISTPDEGGSKAEDGGKVSQQPTVQTEKKKEVVEKVETQPAEELSTSEKAALAEKAKMESEGKEKEEDSANATSEAQQHAKKRGRKPKP